MEMAMETETETETVSLTWTPSAPTSHDGQNLEEVQIPAGGEEAWRGDEPPWPPEQLTVPSDEPKYDVVRASNDPVQRTQKVSEIDDNSLTLESHVTPTADGAESVFAYEDFGKDARYAFRRSGLEIKPGFRTTWLDEDETGDFDLEEHNRNERQQQRRRRARTRQGTKFAASSAQSGSDDDEITDQSSEQEPRRPVLTLTLCSEAGKSLLQQFANDLPKLIAVQHDSFAQGYSLRNKRKSVLDVHPGINNRDLPDDLTGWPEARGCWQCLLLGDRCPLLDDETQYPCLTCLEDGNDCELVQTPSLKRVCESCKSRRQQCSYTYTVNHGDSCSQCQEQGWKCVAGPLNDVIRRRIRYPDADGFDISGTGYHKPAKVKHIITCERCQAHGRECSLNHNDSRSNICIACDMHGFACKPLSTGPLPVYLRHKERLCPTPQRKRKHGEFVDPCGHNESDRLHRPPPRARAERSSPLAKAISEVAATSDTDDDNDEIIITHANTLPQPHDDLQSAQECTQTVIRTKFSHPMKFNHEPGTNNEEPCHFCSQPILAVLGLEARDVFVVDHAADPNDSGRRRGQYTELSGGHATEGIEGTRVCIACTSRRMAVIMCAQHEMRAIPGREDLAGMDGMVALDRLMMQNDAGPDGEGGGKEEEQWCSICPSLAVSACCAAQQSFEGADDDGAGTGEGCGLLLCEACGVLLSGVYDGSLEAMLQDLRDEPCEERPFGLRADAELLKQDGLLVRYVLSEHGG